MQSKNILIIEDEDKVANFIQKGLSTQGALSTIAATGAEAKQLFKTKPFDLILLDIGLPDTNGIELCTYFRNSGSKTPILMLTALGTVTDKVAGFEVGTDDYLVKPFDFMELVVRCKALLKRSTDYRDVKENLEVGGLELDLKEKVARREGKIIELTAKEYGLLEYLMRNKGRVVSKVDIAEKVWDINFDTGTNFVEVYINYLRKKVDKDFSTKLIHTIVGMGYMLKIK
ncbi:DNA-binding response regulator, OmpR family, contains REC and winged-helix (wHTH) domain [Spirosomataceae bacterium TFI 002]|nr:DNA-binding response regulator, OmpR family, contains REC and winged-helix (wHTH) domain [Spirosomataceae bacterium TFI 002]